MRKFNFLKSFTLRYSWCSGALFLEHDFKETDNALSLNDLIPFESNDPEVRKKTHRIVVGHNVGFDRSFIKEQYFSEVNL